MMINSKIKSINFILALTILFTTACNEGRVIKEDHLESAHSPAAIAADDVQPGLQLNNGAKWRADDATRKNVTAIVSVINDPANAGENNREQLSGLLHSKIDTLVYQCRMQGADHDMLHLWLEQLLENVKKIEKAESVAYDAAFSKLNTDAESFFDFFE